MNTPLHGEGHPKLDAPATSIAQLGALARSAAARAELQERRIEQLAELLLAHSNRIHVQDEQQREALRPQAAEAVRTIVQPFFDRLRENNLLDDLAVAFRALPMARQSIRIATQIEFPRAGLAGVWPSSLGDFLPLAEELAAPGRDVGGAVAQFSPLRPYVAWVDLVLNEKPHLELGIWPKGSTGFAVAMAMQQYKVRLPLEGLVNECERLHPQIWIGFAAQIASGAAERAITTQAEDRL